MYIIKLISRKLVYYFSGCKTYFLKKIQITKMSSAAVVISTSRVKETFGEELKYPKSKYCTEDSWVLLYANRERQHHFPVIAYL